MGAGGKLTKGSQAVRLLRRKFESGDVKGDEPPKTVWESESLFQKHKLVNFRSCYNALRVEFKAKESGSGTYHKTMHPCSILYTILT